MCETVIFPLPIWGLFQLIFFHQKSRKASIFLLPVYLAYWPRKRAACWATHVDHFHQAWSWYDCPSPNYSVVGADTLHELVTLTFDLLTLDSGQTGQDRADNTTLFNTVVRSKEIRHHTILRNPNRVPNIKP